MRLCVLLNRDSIGHPRDLLHVTGDLIMPQVAMPDFKSEKLFGSRNGRIGFDILWPVDRRWLGCLAIIPTFFPAFLSSLLLRLRFLLLICCFGSGSLLCVKRMGR